MEGSITVRTILVNTTIQRDHHHHSLLRMKKAASLPPDSMPDSRSGRVRVNVPTEQSADARPRDLQKPEVTFEPSLPAN
jgi:hypothetical protein